MGEKLIRKIQLQKSIDGHMTDLNPITTEDAVNLSSGGTLRDKLATIDSTLAQKVDVVHGKQLSTEDFTTEEKVKLASAASESYVNQKVAELVDSAPGTLDTLKELADALGNDANFATTITEKIGTKVDKEEGKSLISDVEIARLASVRNYDDTEIREELATKALKTDLHEHTNKSVLDGITAEKVQAWDGKAEAVHTHEIAEVNGLQDALDAKVNVEPGKGLSTNDFTTAEKEQLAATASKSQLDEAIRGVQDQIDTFLGFRFVD